MKLVGSKEKGYKLVSSFEKPAKKPKNESNKPDGDSKNSTEADKN